MRDKSGIDWLRLIAGMFDKHFSTIMTVVGALAWIVLITFYIWAIYNGSRPVEDKIEEIQYKNMTCLVFNGSVMTCDWGAWRR